MFSIDLINKFGYSEMYELSELFNINEFSYGRFVTFSENEPEKIRIAKPNDFILGVTTINSSYTSDNPIEWHKKYMYDEYGDALLKKIDLAKAKLLYDEEKEMSYMSTYKISEVTPIINQNYNETQPYVERINRKEWINVNILGKCIVIDNGKCQPASWCTIGENGIAIPDDKNNKSKNSYYVINRFSPKSIIIFFK